MKETLKRELTNILFIVLIIAAAIFIYLLSREQTGGAQVAQSATSTATPALPSDSPQPTAKPLGVPESIFLTYLSSSNAVSAVRTAEERTYVVTSNESPIVKATMRYELTNDCVTSVEFTFPLPAVYKTKGRSLPQRLLYDNAKQLEKALPEGLPAVLCDLMPAACEGDTLRQSNVRYWAEQAVSLKKVGDKFEDKATVYQFLSYRSKGKTSQELVCVLLLSEH